MKFTQLKPEGGDCTAPYSVSEIKAKTVGELIEEILTENPNEWGYIGIKSVKSIFGNPKCEYSYGKLLYSLPEDVLSKQLISVSASGGWSRMDYLITINENGR